ncbi:hypothetical protein KUTeg_001507 [Tegillarca granosa]|uniref:Uncharacterized protein n=1 Tax=Tegillarca granosa TaxID=220873 RepID=A0ABQ9FW10_TEGGR|nr:hypothetical protein KUTeg_001507 [Tegillarca granosa]
MHEMEKEEKEIFIMVTLVDYSSDKETIKRGRKRQRLRHQFSFLGKAAYRATFLLVSDIEKYALEKILKHSLYANYAHELGIPQPAAPRGSDSVPSIYLPCDTTKILVHSKYLSSCEELETLIRSVTYSTFNEIWIQCLPHIKIASPRDVCATCEKYRKAVVDAVTEEEKLEATINMRYHITSAQKGRETIGKDDTQTSGPNVVISMVDWSLESDANTGTRSSFAIHADNCPALPEVIYSAGLYKDRQQYLFPSVRPYVRPAYKDITCPPPVEEEI